MSTSHGSGMSLFEVDKQQIISDFRSVKLLDELCYSHRHNRKHEVIISEGQDTALEFSHLGAAQG